MWDTSVMLSQWQPCLWPAAVQTHVFVGLTHSFEITKPPQLFSTSPLFPVEAWVGGGNRVCFCCWCAQIPLVVWSIVSGNGRENCRWSVSHCHQEVLPNGKLAQLHFFLWTGQRKQLIHVKLMQEQCTDVSPFFVMNCCIQLSMFSHKKRKN